MSEKVQLTVTGMTCGGCENAVQRAVRQLTGVEDVSASHAASQVNVTFDGNRVNAEMIRERIQSLGYTVAP
jgi:copper chaperone CopZ